jgi:hypothetical protein
MTTGGSDVMGKKPASARPSEVQQPPASPVWTGTGLCCEAQGDGVPCRGVDGECESCGRAIPLPVTDAGVIGRTPSGSR